MTVEQDPADDVAMQAATDPAPEDFFLTPVAVPRRQNQMLALGLIFVVVVVLAIVLTLTLLIHYDHMPSLLSYFT
jgi:quinol-cytochrome oxidoreductase complex cytochrome b subunit